MVPVSRLWLALVIALPSLALAAWFAHLSNRAWDTAQRILRGEHPEEER